MPSPDQPETGEYRPYKPGQYLAPILTGETLQLEEQQAQPYLTNANPFSDPSTPNPPISQDYTPPYTHPQTSYESETLYAGSELDHFHHDTEAYASGLYSRPSFVIPRSRSPTPAVDEDYHVSDYDAVHLQHTQYDIEKAALYHQFPSDGYLGNEPNVIYDPVPETPTSMRSSLPETPLETRHFGPAPSGRVARRHRTKKRVQLTNGNFVIDLDVPPRLILPRRGEPETMKTRYTAVTCDPDDFEKRGFFLRQNENGRRIELLIVITMYNVRPCSLVASDALQCYLHQEDEFLFCRTLYGVMRNIAHLCSRKNSQTWGPNAWEKVQ
jgi:chitin synthase